MPFPRSERVHYRRNTLKSVICQLRFPTILKVETSLPADFQECIRDAYPHFQERQAPQGSGIPTDFQGVIPEELQQLFPKGGRHFDFASVDRNKSITLNKDFLSLTTAEYTTWDNFVSDLKGPLDALNRIYRPALFSRIGLRYQNQILRSDLGLEDTSWSDLINARMAGVLADVNVGPHVIECLQVSTVNLEEQFGFVRIQQGLSYDQDEDEQVYIIDSDFFIDQAQEVGNELNVLGHFQRQAGHFFRWAINRRLHDAMAPAQS